MKKRKRVDGQTQLIVGPCGKRKEERKRVYSEEPEYVKSKIKLKWKALRVESNMKKRKRVDKRNCMDDVLG